MKLALLSSLAFVLLAAIPIQEVHPENAEIAEALAKEAGAAEGAVAEEEAPIFLQAVEGKGCGRPGRCVRRYASSSSSSDSCDCCEECNKVYYDYLDFYTSVPTFDTSSFNGTWTHFTYGNFTANDGVLITGCSGGILDSKVYTSFQVGLDANPVRDHAKYWAYANQPIPIPPHGDAVVKWAANVQTFNTEENIFPSAIVERNDYRLASAQFTAFERESGLNFAFVVTNHRVYIMYQRTPEIFDESLLVKADLQDGFTFIIPVKIRRVCDWHDLEIVFHGDSKEVSYHVDEQEVFVINKVGFLLDRNYMVEDLSTAESNLWPAEIQYGFGTFTDLDYYPACQRTESCRACRYPFIRQSLVELNNGDIFTQYNPIFGSPVPPVFYVDSNAGVKYKIWGQGTVAKIRKLIAYQRVPVC